MTTSQAKAPPPRDRKGLRTGFTTGACAAAAAKAGARLLVHGAMLSEIESTLPNRQKVRFALARCERDGERAVCSVIKDAGDDPDCTHGAEIIAEVSLRGLPGIEIDGGAGVARVTKAGLGLVVGTAAVNPVPRRNITEMVEEELEGSPHAGAHVVIRVPGGEKMAEQTTNARLGLIGGISILGTSGIVKPYSTAAYKASVVQAIDVAATRGHANLVFTTGGKSELYAMKLRPDLIEEAFIQVGDFIGVGLRHAARRSVPRVSIVGMIGKLSKMADGRMQTHAAGSEVNLGLLAEIAAQHGASAELVAEIAGANTARHVLERCQAHGFTALIDGVCARVAGVTMAHAAVSVDVALVDFDGRLLGRFPPERLP